MVTITIIVRLLPALVESAASAAGPIKAVPVCKSLAGRAWHHRRHPHTLHTSSLHGSRGSRMRSLVRSSGPNPGGDLTRPHQLLIEQRSMSAEAGEHVEFNETFAEASTCVEWCSATATANQYAIGFCCAHAAPHCVLSPDGSAAYSGASGWTGTQATPANACCLDEYCTGLST